MNAQKTSQNARILEHLKTHDSINFLTAIKEYGVTRLASRISDLKRMGYPIVTDIVADYNEDGEFICNHAEYSLEKEI